MTELLIRAFIKDREDVQNPAVRQRYGVLSGAAGIVLLPGLTAAFGFFLSFSVCCFAAVFGPEGVLLAAAVMGLRCAVTLPCYFLLAVPAWESACLPRGKRRNGWDRGRWVRLGAVCLALLAGLWAELMLSPWLLDAALARVVV